MDDPRVVCLTGLLDANGLGTEKTVAVVVDDASLSGGAMNAVTGHFAGRTAVGFVNVSGVGRGEWSYSLKTLFAFCRCL